MLKEIIKDQKRIFVLEDHSAIGGLADRLLNELVSISEIRGFEFTNLGLREYPECGTLLEVLEYHKLDGKSLAQKISGIADIESLEIIKQKYTEEAPQ
ncbi:MAG TPA: hypothetical protein PK073_10655 [Ignavibacteriaceae bacterium]|jgi:transketolase|nr:MAG: hypothetical protein BWY38_01010 [Ignavibacteria bacterium ADurb.Bin266]OQY71367.1 MAG: hypothetical protein B6D44_13030 [Ignavibacteriales bacterium UTCHB2]HQF43360.1 hypothetical protein [Ignavibacteriaceae bacterium]HQI40767.1 hypothetical protein [Ignavibacteriaceae bacterium]HQJ46914.1 hypothetical protein [Ignavibacteriaceae bacterium]